jgi:putative nucleotidyltransferase with HDIG domain
METSMRRISGPSRSLASSTMSVAAVGSLLTAPVALFLMLRLYPPLDVLFESATFHVLVVSLIALCALGVALPAAAAARRSGRPTPVFLALGCLAVGIFMVAHGLTTPGVAGRPMNMWVARFPVLAILVFAACQGAAVLRPDRALPRFVERHVMGALTLPAAVMAAGATAAILWPAAGYGARPVPGEEAITWLVMGASAALLIGVGALHWRRWRLSKDPVQVALLAACWLCAEALVSLKLGPLWHLSWWDYHALLLTGFGATVFAVLAGYRRTRAAHETLGGLALAEPLELISRSYPESLEVLAAAVEAKHPYTQGHSARVAELAVRVAQRLGLGSERLRAIAAGALLHDIGKIGVPDAILNKPGPLDREERNRIEEHTGAGWQIARKAQSLGGALDVIRHHHERVDGSGYPDGLPGHAISVEAKIVSVVDVWDALTSERSYRPAWAPEQALEIMEEGRGSQFDPRCLDALLAVLEESGTLPLARPGRSRDTAGPVR